jgi:hypothetical protein
MTEHEKEIAAHRLAHGLFGNYLKLDTDQKKSVASALETGKRLLKGRDEKIDHFMQSRDDLPPTEKQKLSELIAEDIMHR